MKNFCDKCNVQIEEEVIYCPLCGRCCNEHNLGKEVVYANFPSDKVFKNKIRQGFNIITTLLILGNLLSIGAELLLYGTFTWNV